MIPGQLRPTFAKSDRIKRYLFTAMAVLVGVVIFVLIGTHHGDLTFGVFAPWFAILIALVITMQVVYRVRLGRIRAVAVRLASEHPEDKFVVGNARWVGRNDRGPDAVPFVTTILQVGSHAVSFWNPDAPERPFAALPLEGLEVAVVATKPPRLSLVEHLAESATYVALFHEVGMSFVTIDELRQSAHQLFPALVPAVAPPPAPPPKKIGF